MGGCHLALHPDTHHPQHTHQPCPLSLMFSLREELVYFVPCILYIMSAYAVKFKGREARARRNRSNNDASPVFASTADTTMTRARTLPRNQKIRAGLRNQLFQPPPNRLASILLLHTFIALDRRRGRPVNTPARTRDEQKDGGIHVTHYFQMIPPERGGVEAFWWAVIGISVRFTSRFGSKTYKMIIIA